MYVFWPSSVMLVVGWRTTILGIMITPSSVVINYLRKEFFNSVGPGRWSGQSGKELVFAAPFMHPEMERQAMEVGRSGSGGF
jgi:hypothetical protein